MVLMLTCVGSSFSQVQFWRQRLLHSCFIQRITMKEHYKYRRQHEITDSAAWQIKKGKPVNRLWSINANRFQIQVVWTTPHLCAWCSEKNKKPNDLQHLVFTVYITLTYPSALCRDREKKGLFLLIGFQSAEPACKLIWSCDPRSLRQSSYVWQEQHVTW